MADDALDGLLVERVKIALGKAISEIRADADLSLRAAARGASLHHTEWGRIERGEVDPKVSTLLRIQRSLKVDSLETLLGATPSLSLLEAPPARPKARRPSRRAK